MELQFYGANTISVSYKGTRIVVDDNLGQLASKSITKPEDVSLFTMAHEPVNSRLVFDKPGEYEVAEISIIGIPTRAHIDDDQSNNATMFKLIAGDISVLITGHIYPSLSDDQLETIGIIDILIIPVGGNGYTLDPQGALKIIRSVEPKIVIPSHYDDKSLKYPVVQQDLDMALKGLAMEPKETLTKLKVKTNELLDSTQLIILEKT